MKLRKCCGAVLTGLAMVGLCSCGTQSSGTSSFWPGSIFHPAQPPQAIAANRQKSANEGGAWDDSDTASSPPVRRKVAPTPVVKAPTQAPVPTVTSTMSGASRQDAETAIGTVNKQLEAIGTSDPGGVPSDDLKLVRKLRDDAQHAFDEQDYLTARSLAQKASVLAAQLPSPPTPRSSR